jgi:hypothetical protein
MVRTYLNAAIVALYGNVFDFDLLPEVVHGVVQQ